jgi:hypothetical protein
MLEKAGEGDIIRATLLWIGPFMDDAIDKRMERFFDAAENGAEIRYLVSTEIFNLGKKEDISGLFQKLMTLMQKLQELRSRGKKFGVKLYAGPKTYNQVSFNTESMALVIAENPVTATWVTRQFNPDLIDNAVKSFDQDWKNGKAPEELTQKDYEMFGVEPEELIRKVIDSDSKEK